MELVLFYVDALFFSFFWSKLLSAAHPLSPFLLHSTPASTNTSIRSEIKKNKRINSGGSYRKDGFPTHPDGYLRHHHLAQLKYKCKCKCRANVPNRTPRHPNMDRLAIEIQAGDHDRCPAGEPAFTAQDPGACGSVG